MLTRLSGNLAHRLGGPLTFRLIIQPAVAAFFAIRAGWRDSQEGRVPLGWAVLTDPVSRRGLLGETWSDVAKVFIAAIAVDCVYQVMEFHWFYPEEAIVVGFILALLPYLLLRGPANPGSAILATGSGLAFMNATGIEMQEHSTDNAPVLDLSTKLAFERTRVSYERTMLSWVRTATSLITFGFSIYKFFQLKQIAGARKNPLLGPREFALVLVSIGLVSLLLATLEYRQNIRTIGIQNGGHPRSLAVIVAALISILGIFALLAMIFRHNCRD